MSLSHAHWSSHLPANVDPAMRVWLTEAGSLTARLIAHSAHFRVHRIRQTSGLVGRDEQRIMQLARQVQVHQRDVVLECDGRPVIFAQSCVPYSATASDWPIFSRLGERSLGSILFGDPLVRRSALQFARLPRRHPLIVRLEAVLGAQDDVTFFARRCLYRRRQGVLLVSEIFLPCIIDLAQQTDAA